MLDDVRNSNLDHKVHRTQETGNPKHEIQNPKEIQNPNAQMFKSIILSLRYGVLGLGHLNFVNLVIVSNFDIRISSFLNSKLNKFQN